MVGARPCADRPQRHGGRSGARAFQRDLAQVQVLRREVRERRVVLVEASDGGIAEQESPAAVWLVPVLARIDPNATADAPAREHSREIWPRCRSFDVKYVNGESCL